MSRNVDKRAICPFFQEEAGCENMPPPMREAHQRTCEKRQRCEGLVASGKIFLEFESKKERDEYREDFCYTYCWEGCYVAAMLLELHGAKASVERNKAVIPPIAEQTDINITDFL